MSQNNNQSNNSNSGSNQFNRGRQSVANTSQMAPGQINGYLNNNGFSNNNFKSLERTTISSTFHNNLENINTMNAPSVISNFNRSFSMSRQSVSNNLNNLIQNNGIQPQSNNYGMHSSSKPSNETQSQTHQTISFNTTSGGGGSRDQQLEVSQVENIFNFLMDFKYPHNINYKDISKPSTKTFNSIFGFLIGLLQPGYFEGEQFSAQEILFILQYIGYPVNISQKSFEAIGAPHSWGQVLGILNWLVQMNKYQFEMEYEELEKNEKKKYQYKKQVGIEISGKEEESLQMMGIDIRENCPNLNDIELINEFIAASFQEKPLDEEDLLYSPENRSERLLEQLKQKSKEHIENAIDMESKIENLRYSKKKLETEQPEIRETDRKIEKQTEILDSLLREIQTVSNNVNETDNQVDSLRLQHVKRINELEQLQEKKKDLEYCIKHQILNMEQFQKLSIEISQNQLERQKLMNIRQFQCQAKENTYLTIQKLKGQVQGLINQFNDVINSSPDIFAQSSMLSLKLNENIFQDASMKEIIKEKIQITDYEGLSVYWLNIDLETIETILNELLAQLQNCISSISEKITADEHEIRSENSVLIKLQNERQLMKLNISQLDEDFSYQLESSQKELEFRKKQSEQVFKRLCQTQNEIAKWQCSSQALDQEVGELLQNLEVFSHQFEQIKLETESLQREDYEKAKMFKLGADQVVQQVRSQIQTLNNSLKQIRDGD